MKYYYIADPASGNGTLSGIQNNLKAKLKDLDIEGEFIKVIGKNDASKVARLALKQGYDSLITIGSDHTLNEVLTIVADWLSENTGPIYIGIIPVGVPNSIAKKLGISSWQEACLAIAAGNFQDVSFGFVNDVVMINNFTLISKENAEHSLGEIKQKPGLKIYQKNKIDTYSPFDYELKLNNKTSISGRAINITAVNSSLFSNPKTEQLTIIIDSKRQSQSLFEKISFTKPQPTRDQTLVHGSDIQLNTSAECVLQVDGSSYVGKSFHAGITNLKIKLFAKQ